MHLRVTTVRRKGKTYRYAQLVESYRRKDGVPAHRVLSSLGQLTGVEVANIRAALAASREGRAVVVKEAAGKPVPVGFIRANLRYLDVAVMRTVWDEWGLGALLDELTESSEMEVPIADMVQGLVLHRVLDPGSKLHAQRWYPTTALPELSGVRPGQFNNTRIHRVLDHLESIDDKLQERLAERCQSRQAFSALFLDVSDTWFVGQGPELARKGKTKEGLVRRKIGIVLLVNEDGYPLRWQVVHGKSYDAHVMQEIVDSIAECDWAIDVPLVCDRIMGRKTALGQMASSGMKFLTAIPAVEIDGYTDRIPYEQFTCLEPELKDDSLDRDRRLVVRAAREAGLTGLPGDDLVFYLDLGVVTKRQPGHIDPGAIRDYVWEKTDTPPAVTALIEAKAIAEALGGPERLTYADIASRHGHSKHWAYLRMMLMKLSSDIQEAVLGGYGAHVGVRRLQKLAQTRDPQRQREQFEEMVKTGRSKYASARVQSGVKGRPKSRKDGEALQIRAVIGFNVQFFIDTRRMAEEKLQRFYSYLRSLNIRVLNPRSRLTGETAVTQAKAKLKTMDLSDIFDVSVDDSPGSGDRGASQVRATFSGRAWNSRRRYDGFALLAAAPDLTLDGEQLYRLYRSKDAVEKDFQVIKSVLKVRPVRHRTDPKVRGHVTLCMLALLLERTLKTKLRTLPTIGSAEAAVEILRTCHLNLCGQDVRSPTYYTVTEPNNEQTALLTALGLEDLAKDSYVSEQVTPRLRE